MNNWLLKPWDLQSCKKNSLWNSFNFSEHNSRSFNEKVNTFVYIFGDRLYPQVTFGMLLCVRKPSTSVTAVSHLIKYDYSVIELYNVIFRKTDVFSVWRDVIKETNLNSIGANAKGLRLPHTLTLRTEIAKTSTTDFNQEACATLL